MPSVSLNTATAITGLTKRTLWRHIHRGSLAVINSNEPGEETQVNLVDIVPLACIQITAADYEIITNADTGNAIAQTDLALLFLAADRPIDAVFWLTRAAHQHYPDAMCYLGRCHLAGIGTERNEDMGMLWLSHAAVKGHPFAQALTYWLQSPAGQIQYTNNDHAALNTALDAIESELLLKTVQSTVKD